MALIGKSSLSVFHEDLAARERKERILCPKSAILHQKGAAFSHHFSSCGSAVSIPFISGQNLG